MDDEAYKKQSKRIRQRKIIYAGWISHIPFSLSFALALSFLISFHYVFLLILYVWIRDGNCVHRKRWRNTPHTESNQILQQTRGWSDGIWNLVNTYLISTQISIKCVVCNFNVLFDTRIRAKTPQKCWKWLTIRSCACVFVTLKRNCFIKRDNRRW